MREKDALLGRWITRPATHVLSAGGKSIVENQALWLLGVRLQKIVKGSLPEHLRLLIERQIIVLQQHHSVEFCHSGKKHGVFIGKIICDRYDDFLAVFILVFWL